MHLGEISFCDKVGYNIKSDDYKRKILTELEELAGFSVVQKHHERYSDRLLPMLQKNPHLVSVKTNGNPYLLYLTKYNFANQCIFIDKKIQHGYFFPRMIIAKLWFDDALFNGTLLDGEMIKTSNGGLWHFVINDIIFETGQQFQQLTTWNLIKRMNRVYNILETMYREDEVSCCILRVKKYFTYEEIPYISDTFMKTLDYTCRGLYFKPLYLKFRDILINFDDTLVKKVVRTKFKDGAFLEQQDNVDSVNVLSDNIESIDIANLHNKIPEINGQSSDESIFYIKKTNQPDVYELHNVNTGSFDGSSYACVASMTTSKLLRDVFNGINMNERIKFQCKLHAKFGKWVPIAKI
jgi:hypothetical protein